MYFLMKPYFQLLVKLALFLGFSVMGANTFFSYILVGSDFFFSFLMERILSNLVAYKLDPLNFICLAP